MRIMKLKILLIIVLTFLFQSVYSQEPLQEARLIKTIDENIEDPMESIYDLSNFLASRINQEDDLIAIRVCSQFPLSISLNLVRDNPIESAKYLKKNGIPMENIIFLRQEKKCQNKQNTFTEYWVVPKKAQLPDFVEKENAKKITAKILVSSDKLFDINDETNCKVPKEVDNSNFKSLISDISEKLNASDNSLVLILFSKKDSKQKTLSENIKIAKDILRNKNVSKNKIFVISTPVTTDKKYPKIVIINKGSG